MTRADAAAPARGPSFHSPQSAGEPVRRDIQGLRALAVGLVLLFHLWPDRLPGGYVGVDVFFVISGFLITSHLMRIPPTGVRAIGAFWARRIRRLLPASLLVIAVTTAVGTFLLPSTRLADLTRDTLGAVFYGINWVLAANSVDYLGAEDAASPLQHFWSLAVEEQFYVIWPLLFAVALALVARRDTAARRRAVIVAVAVFLVASLVTSIGWTAIQPASAYFVTPTRVWELAAGGLLGIAGTRAIEQRLPAAARGVIAWIGILLIGAAALLLDTATPFPGIAAALPVGGALLVLATATDDVRGSPSTVLSIRPIQYLGDISYSLYLWHWPLIVLAPFAIGTPGLAQKIAILVASVLLAGLSKRFVEDPVRRAPALRTTRRTMALGVAAMLLVAATAIAPQVRLEFEAERAAQQQEQAAEENRGCLGAPALVEPDCDPRGVGMIPTPAQALDDISDAYADDCFALPPFDEVVTCTYGNSADPTMRIALVGNSHAAQWLPAMQEVARERDAELVTYIGSRCSPTSAVIAFDTSADEAGCTGWGEDVVTATAGRYDLIVMTAAAEADLAGMVGQDQFDAKAEGFASPLQDYADAGQPVLLIRDTPIPGFSVPDCLAAGPADVAACDGTTATWLLPDPQVAAAESVGSDDIHVVDFSDHFCLAGHCYAVIGGVLVYFDTLHITATFSATLAPYVNDAIEALGIAAP